MKNAMLLYIDPGTGAMLFTVIIGIVTTLMFVAQKVILKIKFILTGGKAVSKDASSQGIVIFSDSKRYWNVFKPICDEFEKRKVKCHYLTACNDDAALSEPYEYVKCEFIGEGNKAFAKLNMMTADICLSTTPGLDVYQWKRSKNVKYYVHVPHEIGEITAYRMFGIDYYDAVLLNGEFQKENIRELEKIRGLHEKELCVVGAPYMDTLMDRINSSSTKVNKCTTVLLAPSWGNMSILNRYGEAFLEHLKNTGYKIVVRPHPQSKISDPELLDRLQKKYPDSEMFEWNYDTDNYNALNNADILISDFSGVVFEFSLIFGKPFIYSNADMDRSPYDSCWLSEEPWRFRILPEIGKELKEEEFDNIKEVIDNTISSREYAEGRARIKDMAWQKQGNAAENIVDYLLSKEN